MTRKTKQITTANSNENLNSIIDLEKKISENTHIKVFYDKTKLNEFIGEKSNLYYIERKINESCKYYVYDKNARYIENSNRFMTKEQAKLHLSNETNKNLFQEDKYIDGTKFFIVATKKEIYEQSKKKIYIRCMNNTRKMKRQD